MRFGRRIPNTGPAGAVLLGGYVVAMVYGFYRVAQNNQWRRELHEEKKEARKAVIPALQAEEDRAFLARQRRQEEYERQVAGDLDLVNPGESVYKTSVTWVPPAADCIPNPFRAR